MKIKKPLRYQMPKAQARQLAKTTYGTGQITPQRFNKFAEERGYEKAVKMTEDYLISDALDRAGVTPQELMNAKLSPSTLKAYQRIRKGNTYLPDTRGLGNFLKIFRPSPATALPFYNPSAWLTAGAGITAQRLVAATYGLEKDEDGIYLPTEERVDDVWQAAALGVGAAAGVAGLNVLANKANNKLPDYPEPIFQDGNFRAPEGFEEQQGLRRALKPGDTEVNLDLRGAKKNRTTPLEINLDGGKPTTTPKASSLQIKSAPQVTQSSPSGVITTPDVQRPTQRFGAPVNGLVQGPEPLQTPTSSAFGSDAARQIMDDTLPRQQLDMRGGAISTRSQLQDARLRQQQLTIQAQQQAFSGNTPTTTPQQPSMANELIDARRSRVDVRRDYEVPTSPTANNQQMQDMLNRQQTLQQDARNQLRNPRKAPKAPRNVNPGVSVPGRAPTVPLTKVPIPTMTGGGIRMRGGVTTRGSIIGAVGEAILTPLLKPVAEAGGELLARGIYNIPGVNDVGESFDEYQAQKKSVREMDERNEQIRLQRIVEANRPIKPGEAPAAPVLPPPPTSEPVETIEEVEARLPQVHQIHSPAHRPQKEQTRTPPRAPRQTRKAPSKQMLINREYDRLRESNPDAALAYGKKKHKEMYPHLY